jgi:Spherulation-specific family 4
VWPVVAVIAIVWAAAACGGTSQPTDPGQTSPGQTSPGQTSPGQTSPSASTVKSCPQLVVPAYFYSSAIWTQAADSEPTPSNIILDISGEGAGDAPEAHFQAVAQQAEAAGITILGYISTVDGQRSVSEVETEVRNYKAWYGVTNIFLDRVSGEPQQVAYYQQLVNYIHQFDAGSSVWLNPGDFPDQQYMSIGNVVMVFEGTYAQYLTLQVPSWVDQYPASKFAHTIYATSAADLENALNLAASRRVGHVYVTDGSGANPYAGLPSYWSREDSVASSGCVAG